MSCIKTGCHAHLAPYNEWVYGDAFKLFGVTYFRIVQRGMKPLAPVKHFTINDWAQWFDEGITSSERPSTMICGPGAVKNHGYDGVAI